MLKFNPVAGTLDYYENGGITPDADATTKGKLKLTNDLGGTADLPTVPGLANKQPLDPTLTALAAHNTNGILTQTAADTFTGRTITGTTNQITVTNGDGVSGNPTLSLPQDIHTGASPTFAGGTLTGTLTSRTIAPSTDNTYTLGSTTSYFSNTYTRRVYFNSTNYVTGEYAGVTQFVTSGTGNVAEFKNTVNDTKFALNAVAGKGSFSILSATADYRAFAADGGGKLYWRIGNYGNNSLAFRTNSDGFTGYVDSVALTIDGSQKAKFFGDIESADKNIVLGTTTGTKIGTATNQKLGFYNATPIVQPSATPANATDLATALTLVNDIKSKLVTLGLIA